MKRFFFGGPGGAAPLADVGLALLRVSVGLMMAFGHGWFKFPPPAGFVEGVGKLGFPAPGAFAWGATLSEFFGGLLLAMGLLTRPAALLVVGTMAVAAFGQHAADPLFLQSIPRDAPPELKGRAKEMALLYLMPALLFVFTGSGRYGLDALFWRRDSRRGLPLGGGGPSPLR